MNLMMSKILYGHFDISSISYSPSRKATKANIGKIRKEIRDGRGEGPNETSLTWYLPMSGQVVFLVL